MKRLAMVAMVTLLTLSACGTDDDADTATGPDETTEGAQGSALEFAVKIDGESKNFNGEFTMFSPSKLSARPGDTVNFELPRFSGAPHTVTFGTLVDAALAKFRSLPPTTTIAGSENFPEMKKLTDIFPHEVGQGPPSPNQSAAQPCFLQTGEPPNNLKGGAAACPKVEKPELDGTYSFFNSGALNASGDEFSVKLSKNIKAGDYSFMCLVHRGGMSGVLTVVAEGTAVPSPDEVKKAGEDEFAKVEAAGTAALKAAQASATASKAVAGTGDPKAPSVIVAEFAPKSISIPVGGSVTWNMFAFHTISFNAKDSDIGVMAKTPDGAWQFLPSGAPSGFRPPPELGGFPPPDNSKPVLVDGGKWDGSGTKSTGILGSLPPRFVSVKQTFTKAGTYTLRCLVHPEMKGEVKVG